MKIGEIKQIKDSFVNLKSKSNDQVSIETQILFGETIEILKIFKNKVFCRNIFDNYEGWINKKSLGNILKETHIITKPKCWVFEKPDIKSKSIIPLFLNSKVTVKRKKNDWYEIFLKNKYKTGFVHKIFLNEVNNFLINDWVNFTLSFLNTPYLWGGKTFNGIDCSGLVQIILQIHGINLPRNSNDQLDFSSNSLIITNKIKRGCLIFWKGHVAIAIDNKTLIHSNIYDMCVSIDKIHNVIKRIRKHSGDIICVKQVCKS